MNNKASEKFRLANFFDSQFNKVCICNIFLDIFLDFEIDSLYPTLVYAVKYGVSHVCQGKM